MKEQAQEKANELIKKFSSKDNAKICVEEILTELKESFEVAKELHPHAEGLIAGSLAIWISVKHELDAI